MYIVNSKTKEHRLLSDLRDEDCQYYWYLVPTSPDGWIEWNGGECPLPDDTLHEIKIKGGIVEYDNHPQSWRWEHKGYNDVIAYRPILSDSGEESTRDFLKNMFESVYEQSLNEDKGKCINDYRALKKKCEAIMRGHVQSAMEEIEDVCGTTPTTVDLTIADQRTIGSEYVKGALTGVSIEFDSGG